MTDTVEMDLRAALGQAIVDRDLARSVAGAVTELEKTITSLLTQVDKVTLEREEAVQMAHRQQSRIETLDGIVGHHEDRVRRDTRKWQEVGDYARDACKAGEICRDGLVRFLDEFNLGPVGDTRLVDIVATFTVRVTNAESDSQAESWAVSAIEAISSNDDDVVLVDECADFESNNVRADEDNLR